MAVAANKRSVMTLFASASDIESHQVRIVLAEKGVAYDVVYVDPSNPPQELLELNPYGSVPTLIDRELVLYQSRIIMEYLDERFPHPPLMPVYPVARGNHRLLMHRIEKDWYAKFEQLQIDATNMVVRKELVTELLAIEPLLDEYPFFMNEEFGLVDCYLAPLLWRLPSVGINLDAGAGRALKAYMLRVFERDAFQASLTERERELRELREI